MRAQIRHPIYKLNCDLQLMVLAAALDASEFPMISQKMLFVFLLRLDKRGGTSQEILLKTSPGQEKCPHALA